MMSSYYFSWINSSKYSSVYLQIHRHTIIWAFVITSDSSSRSLPETGHLISTVLRDDKTHKSKIANSDTPTHNKKIQILKCLRCEEEGEKIKILAIFFSAVILGRFLCPTWKKSQKVWKQNMPPELKSRFLHIYTNDTSVKIHITKSPVSVECK